jgi:uncharacterized OsmC-like protein
LSAEATGEVELEDGVLVLKRIHVRYTLSLPPGKDDIARRVHDVHHRACPVYRSISGCVDITTELVTRRDEASEGTASAG